MAINLSMELTEIETFKRPALFPKKGGISETDKTVIKNILYGNEKTLSRDEQDTLEKIVVPKEKRNYNATIAKILNKYVEIEEIPDAMTIDTTAVARIAKKAEEPAKTGDPKITRE
jgi:hypothetical protein